MSEPIFIMQNITKQFPGVLALDNVTFEVDEGEVHALVGENGAGKSTLMKILSGLYHYDSGSVLYKGEEIRIQHTRQMRELGISTIYQELNLCTNMSVAENIFLAKEPTKSVLKVVDEDHIVEESAKYLKLLDSDIDPKRNVGMLSIAEQQIVEIAKALSYESQVIIMDEPTSSLTLRETDKLMEIIRRLKDQGRSIVYISHRLEEIFLIADKVTVLRDGKHMGTKNIDEVDYNEVVRMMVGREIENKYAKSHAGTHKEIISETLLEVDGLKIDGLLAEISFTLHPGEILGFSGLVGAGRTELMEAIYGLREIDEGEIKISGRLTTIKSPKDAIKNGLLMTSEDRKNKSLFLNFNIRENITIAFLREMTKSGYIQSITERNFVKQFIKMLNIKPPDSEFQTITMSGGNQQKVVIAKSLACEPNILIMDEPTRGIDVGAKAEMYRIIKDLASQGKGIIVVSSELPEILLLCDRILVMNKGELVGEFLNEEATEEKIMELSV